MANDHAFSAGKPALVFLGAVMIALTGCAQPPHYRNAAHPDYGPAAFNKDQDECQQANSQQVVHVGNYGESTRTVVDEDKAKACLTARGWQPAQN